MYMYVCEPAKKKKRAERKEKTQEKKSIMVIAIQSGSYS